MPSKPVIGEIALSIIILLLMWNIVFFMINALVGFFDFQTLIAEYDPWFLKPLVDFYTSFYGWFTTIIVDATALTFLIVISYVYDLTEAEWE